MRTSKIAPVVAVALFLSAAVVLARQDSRLAPSDVRLADFGSLSEDRPAYAEVTIANPLAAQAEAPQEMLPIPPPAPALEPYPMPVPTPAPTPRPTRTPSPAVAVNTPPRPKPTSPSKKTAKALKVVRFGPGGSQGQFLALLRNMSIDVIELRAGTYRGWHLTLDVNRTRPVLVRPAHGARVVWDDAGGSSGDALFYVGYHRFTRNVRFDPRGTGGSFTIQNYRLGPRGLICTFWVNHVTFNGFHTRGITGIAGGQLSWTVYISSDGAHSGSNITLNDWYVARSANRNVGGLTSYHNPNSRGITALRWHIDGASSAIAMWGTASRINIQGWRITNCRYAVSSDGVASGILKNNRSTGSTYSPIIRKPLINGSGNSWH